MVRIPPSQAKANVETTSGRKTSSNAGPEDNVGLKRGETGGAGGNDSSSNGGSGDVVDAGSLLVLTGKDVDSILSSLDPERALQSQSQVFSAFSSPTESPSPTAADGSNSTSAAAAGAAVDIPIQAPPRVGLSSPNVTSLFMPSQAPSSGSGIKIVSIPSSGSGGLPASTVLLDKATGRVGAMINARKLTALRNAAGSALFVRTFPPREPPRNLLIFGTGAQAYAHATIFLKLFESIRAVTIVARQRTTRAEDVISTLKSEFNDIEFTLGISDPTLSSSAGTGTSQETGFNLSQAVHNANIILTLTPSLVPLFNSVDMTSQTHLVLIGSYKPHMREVSDEVIHRSGVLVVDTKEGCGREAGEVISSGIMSGEGEDGGRVVELGECLGQGERAGEVRRRVEGRGDLMVYKSVGIGIQDIAIADLVLSEARRRGLGTTIPNYD